MKQPTDPEAPIPTAPVVANLKPVSRAEASSSKQGGGALREFYWAEDVHRMLDMTNASIKDMARAGDTSRAMVGELNDQVEELKKVNEVLMADLNAEIEKRKALENKVAEMEAKAAAKEDAGAKELAAERAALEVRAKEVDEQCQAALELQAAIAEERQALDMDKHYLEQEVLAQQEIAAELHEVMANYCRYEEESAERAVMHGSVENTFSDSSFHDAASGSIEAEAAGEGSPEAEAIVRQLHSRLNTIASKWKETEDPNSPSAAARAEVLRRMSSGTGATGEATEKDMYTTP